MPKVTRAPGGVFAGSKFCWAEGASPGRNQFVSFERRFRLAAGDLSGTLHLFADTRYRLWVNGRFAGYGPGRFVTAHPVYDSHDLAPLLVPGDNTIRVEVNFYGCSSFQSMPDGRPGFLAAGRAGPDADLATPGGWLARVHRAWDAEAPHFSFAQNPAEICDTRILAAELASPATAAAAPVPPEDAPWGEPARRSAPYPDYAPVRPARVRLAASAARRLRWGARLPDAPAAAGSDNYIRYMAWIHSPSAQEVPLECFWTDFSLNGEPLAISGSGRRGNHGEATARLRAGWNVLAGCVELLRPGWSFLLGLPAEAGIALRALPDLACPHALAFSPPGVPRGVPETPAAPGGFALPPGWTLDSGDPLRATPARLAAWDGPEESTAVRNLPFERLPEVAGRVAEAAIWSFDFEDEYYGHPVIEVEAPAGAVMDVAYDDWARGDGCANLYGSNPFTDACDRFILSGGRQRVEAVNPRGGIILQVILRAPPGAGAAELRVADLFVRRRVTMTERAGAFRCGDAVLDWAWDKSLHTLQASTDEAYADCPWRERGSYIGDSLVNLHLHSLVTADLRVARGTLARFGQAQLPDGSLPACAPAWHMRPHGDFTLLWIQAVRDYWARTGDTAFAAEQWPVVQRIWGSPAWHADAHGLWDATGMRLFVDWGALRSEREGEANLVANALRVAAARASAELADAIGHAAEAARHRAEADRVAAAMVERLWMEEEGRFAASAGARTPAAHGNVLALRHGIGPAERILAYLEPLLLDNLRRGRESGQHGGFLELYYFFFLLPALAACRRFDLAERLIREHYGFIRSLGLPTLPECFHRADKGAGSCCHSWSGAPAIYAAAFILGLRQERPGDPDRWLLSPESEAHTRAEGALPHARGVLRVRWTRDGSRMRAHVEAPDGVSIIPGPGVEIA